MDWESGNERCREIYRKYRNRTYNGDENVVHILLKCNETEVVIAVTG